MDSHRCKYDAELNAARVGVRRRLCTAARLSLPFLESEFGRDLWRRFRSGARSGGEARRWTGSEREEEEGDEITD